MSAEGEGHAPAAGAEAPGAPAPHLYDAVSTQRDQVVGAFDTQRSAIVRAVADQREAALGPIRAVRARQAAQAAAPSVSPLPSGRALQPSLHQQIAAEIVATLKAMVAEEVRVQLTGLLQAETAPPRRD